MGVVETSNTDAKHAVVLAQNHRSCVGPIETCYSGPEDAVLNAKTTGGVLDPQAHVILVLNSLFCKHNNTGEGWNQYSPFIISLSTLLCVLKATYEVWDQYRLISQVLKSLFYMQKPQMRAGTHRD